MCVSVPCEALTQVETMEGLGHTISCEPDIVCGHSTSHSEISDCTGLYSDFDVLVIHSEIEYMGYLLMGQQLILKQKVHLITAKTCDLFQSNNLHFCCS